MTIERPMTIGRVARELDVRPSALRHYEKLGLLDPPRHAESGYRTFTRNDVERARFIVRARELGFGLEEIHEIIGVHERGLATCALVLDRIREKVEEAERNIAELVAFRDLLVEIERNASRDGDASSADGPPGRVCCVIEGSDPRGAPGRRAPEAKGEN